MKDIFIGFAIIIIMALVIDFIYTEKNTCMVSDPAGTHEYKCGILKKQMNIDIKLLDRYW